MNTNKPNEFIFNPILGSTAALIEPTSRMSISEIQTPWLIKQLKKSGTLIFRGFEIDRQRFSDFIETNTSRRTADPARKAQVKNAQIIMAGSDAMGLHVENGNLPFLPELQFFFCEVASKKAGKTTFCDGYDVWRDLPGEVQNLFINKKLKYERNIPEHLWKKYLAAELEIDIEKVGENELKFVEQIVEGQTYKLNSDGSVHSTYIIPAVNTTKFSRKLAFANSLLGPSFNYEKPKITFDDNTEIPGKILQIIKETTEKHTHEIDWKDGDMIVIDNTRVMHGRRKLENEPRQIFGAQGYL